MHPEILKFYDCFYAVVQRLFRHQLKTLRPGKKHNSTNCHSFDARLQHTNRISERKSQSCGVASRNHIQTKSPIIKYKCTLNNLFVHAHKMPANQNVMMRGKPGEK
jgi:hypothetical protein